MPLKTTTFEAAKLSWESAWTQVRVLDHSGTIDDEHGFPRLPRPLVERLVQAVHLVIENIRQERKRIAQLLALCGACSRRIDLQMFQMAKDIAGLLGRKPATANEYRQLIGKPAKT